MDIMGETAVVEPLDLTDIKAYLALVPTDTSMDGLLLQCASQARERLEPYLPFWIAEREIEAEGSLDTMARGTVKGPVSAVRSASVKRATGWESVEPSGIGAEGGLLLFPEDCAGLEAKVAYRAGSCLPGPVQTALLMMVRQIYTDRTSDPLTPAVAGMIGPYRRRI